MGSGTSFWLWLKTTRRLSFGDSQNQFKTGLESTTLDLLLSNWTILIKSYDQNYPRLIQDFDKTNDYSKTVIYRMPQKKNTCLKRFKERIVREEKLTKLPTFLVILKK